MDVSELTEAACDPAVALWGDAGLTRPWNDPASDFDRAVASPSSAVLGVFAREDLAGTVMVGDDEVVVRSRWLTEPS